MWGAVVSSLVLIAAGALVWWLAGACARTLTGAVGTVVGGILSLIPLVVMTDQDAAMRVSFAITMVTVVWLLAWTLAGGIRAQQLAREATERTERTERTSDSLREGAPRV